MQSTRRCARAYPWRQGRRSAAPIWSRPRPGLPWRYRTRGIHCGTDSLRAASQAVKNVRTSSHQRLAPRGPARRRRSAGDKSSAVVTSTMGGWEKEGQARAVTISIAKVEHGADDFSLVRGRRGHCGQHPTEVSHAHRAALPRRGPLAGTCRQPCNAGKTADGRTGRRRCARRHAPQLDTRAARWKDGSWLRLGGGLGIGSPLACQARRAAPDRRRRASRCAPRWACAPRRRPASCRSCRAPSWRPASWRPASCDMRRLLARNLVQLETEK